MITTAILGASGFSGQETLDRVLGHPELELVALGSDSLAGQPVGALDPRLARNGHGPLPAFVPNDAALAAGADLVFVCLDNELEPPEDAVVVDLSGSHRTGFDEWCYALPELAPPTGRLIANPGCYATAALLALAPIAGIVDPATVVVDGKSGISGAGRTPKDRSHAAAVLENVSPYAVGEHRHAPEIARLLGFPVTFVPHVVPLRRGLVCTCYVTASEDPRPLLEAAYAGSHVVEVIETVPDLARLQGTDAAEIAVFEDRSTGRWIVVGAIDNLGKGAAGQAVQNANLALGLEETAGLRLSGVLV
ncbi:MAG TPA: N-acetyl-gamma-glutamyl-phosphate reductase [Gaiellaceae bacterium]|nr:N-acetyl-gamma-glutamyl-phosphate reductase [Gaiellaceae bacterium]